jgi:membrane protease YdiL (CAAX protease family)
MNPRWKLSVIGVLAAIAITTAMDATGYSALSALPLCPLMALLCYLERFSRTEIGFVWGRLRHYGLALLHPLVVLGLLALVAWQRGAVNVETINWPKAWFNTAIVAGATILVATVTEEGFFRGWLWASLRRAGQDDRGALIWSSLAFTAWHLSAIFLDTGFNPPPSQAPVLIANVCVIGALWGMFRWVSGSVIVTSVVHGVWNGGAYVFFGVGTKVGALGIQETSVYGPEVGVLGLALNLLFVAALWYWCRRHVTSYTLRHGPQAASSSAEPAPGLQPASPSSGSGVKSTPS